MCLVSCSWLLTPVSSCKIQINTDYLGPHTHTHTLTLMATQTTGHAPWKCIFPQPCSHTGYLFELSYGESCNSQLGISLTKGEEGQLGGQSRCRGKEIKISFKGDLTLYHPSLILPYNCYLYILCLKKNKTKLFIDWAVAQAFGLSSSPRSCKINLTKLWSEATFNWKSIQNKELRPRVQGPAFLPFSLSGTSLIQSWWRVLLCQERDQG